MNDWELDGDITVKEGKLIEAKEILRGFHCDIVSQNKHQIIFDFYGKTSRSRVSGFADSLKGLVAEGTIDALDEDEMAYSTYMFHDGTYDFTDGITLVYYPGHADRFVDRIPREIVEAVLKKYGNAQ